MIKTIRRLLGMEKFEMPREPVEFTYIRPVIESHISGSWCMGKTPENPAIRVHLDGKIIPPLLEQQLKELADYHDFKIEIHCSTSTAKRGER